MIIDLFAFCRSGEKRGGKWPIAELARLRGECVSDEGEIEWMLVGEVSTLVAGHPVLRLTVNGVVQLKCQRCLEPYEFHIQSGSAMLIAEDEQTADQLEDSWFELELEDAAEVIVGSRSFDVQALIEDEALLALPISPKHDVCPNEQTKPDPLKMADDKEKKSPFSALMGLLKAKPTAEKPKKGRKN